MPVPERTKKVRILAHPATPIDPETGEFRHVSGVSTSLGDKFHDDVVELPESEVKMLFALNRAEEVVEKKGKSKDKDAA